MKYGSFQIRLKFGKQAYCMVEVRKGEEAAIIPTLTNFPIFPGNGRRNAANLCWRELLAGLGLARPQACPKRQRELVATFLKQVHYRIKRKHLDFVAL